MGKSDLTTTAIKDLEVQVQDNEALLTTLTNYITKFSNDSILSSLDEMLIEIRLTNSYLRSLIGDELVNSEENDSTLNAEVL